MQGAGRGSIGGARFVKAPGLLQDPASAIEQKFLARGALDLVLKPRQGGIVSVSADFQIHRPTKNTINPTGTIDPRAAHFGNASIIENEVNMMTGSRAA